MATVGDEDARRLLVDVGLLLAVAGLLVAVHVLVPAGLQDALALQYGRADPLHAFTAAYVHLTDIHLYRNLAGWLAGGTWALLVSRVAGERRWFRFSLLWFLTALPVAVGMTGAGLIGGPLTSRGFSGVVAGFAGFGLVGVAMVLHRAFGVDRWLAWDAVAAVVVVVGAEIVWLVTGGVPPLFIGLLLAGFGLTLVPFARAGLRAGTPVDRDGWVRVVGAGGTTVLLAGLVAVFVAGLFPTELATDGSVTNIFGHYLGLVYGAIIAGWGARYWAAPVAGTPLNRRS